MKKVIAIKTTIYIALIIIFVGIFSESFLQTMQKMNGSFDQFLAKQTAIKCAAIINSFYSNSASALEESGLNCYLKEPQVIASKKGIAEKTASLLNNKTQIVQTKNSAKITIRKNDPDE